MQLRPLGKTGLSIAPLVFGARNYLIAPSVKGWEPAPVGIYQYKKVYLQGP